MDHRKRMSIIQARIEPELLKRAKLAAVEKDLSMQAFVAAALEAACSRVEKQVARPSRSAHQAA